MLRARALHQGVGGQSHGRRESRQAGRTVGGAPCPIVMCAQAMAPIEAEAQGKDKRTGVFPRRDGPCGFTAVSLYARNELHDQKTHVTRGGSIQIRISFAAVKPHGRLADEKHLCA